MRHAEHNATDTTTARRLTLIVLWRAGGARSDMIRAHTGEEKTEASLAPSPSDPATKPEAIRRRNRDG